MSPTRFIDANGRAFAVDGPLVVDFTLERLPGISHWVQETPDIVNANMTSWLERKGLVAL